jgi:hypothetical protein
MDNVKKDNRITAYLLRNIPRSLWTRAKHRAVTDGISLRALILRALFAYLS